MRSHLHPAGTTILALLALIGVCLAGPARASDSKSESASRRAWLGVSTQSLDGELRDGLDYKGKGVLVNQVVEDSPADHAGLRQGDVIVSVNGAAVESPEALQTAVRRGHPGDKVRLDVARENRRETLTATLGVRSDEMNMSRMTVHDDDESSDDDSMPDLDELKSLGSLQELKALKNLGELPIPGRGRLGVQLQDLDGDLGSYFSVPEGKGALIVEVEQESPAARAGLKAGDVIVKVNDDNVEDSDDASRAIREREGKISITIVRRGQRQTVNAELAPRARIQRVIRGHGPTMFVAPMTPMAPMAPMAPMTPETMHRNMSSLHREMEQLREEIRQLREELQKTKN